jgi:protein-tyrosine-phosphatase
VWAAGGEPASPAAVEVLAKKGVALGDHRSQPVTPALLEQADIVLVMEEVHRRSLFYLTPQHLRKVFLLSEMIGRHDDVADPYGGPVEAYAAAAGLLEKLIDAGLPRILQQIGVEYGQEKD